ncbi:phage tail assembly chaperone [Duganella sp. LjRoot269]|uniref:phage tail assembly chaperone n=1 Tax=Duganella sp. LjRoot269 TaxID=3342305 RepID=UPI003ED038CC
MAIKLGSNPKHFTKEVPIIKLDGATDILTITYIYRTRRDFAKLLDERMAAQTMVDAAAEVTAAADAVPKGPVSVEVAYLESTKQSAENVLQIASGWDLVDAFTADKLQQLEDEFPGALNDIQMAYQKAVAEVRTKN